MVKKKSLLGGMSIKVENMSGFDKSGYNALTAPLGAIVPLRKQLMIPGNFKLRVALSAQLPPLATDAFLRTHLKVEAFFCPLRLCYGGFQSWFAGEEGINLDDVSSAELEFMRAKLPRLGIYKPNWSDQEAEYTTTDFMDDVFGAHTLMDYFGCKWPLLAGHPNLALWPNYEAGDVVQYFNIFPFVAYQLIYHHFYRNKTIEKPLFAPTFADGTSGSAGHLSALPFCQFSQIHDFVLGTNYGGESGPTSFDEMTDFNGSDIALANGHLLELRKRNYGHDYFTTCLPSAESGASISVDTSGGSFTISALRAQNAMAHFEEINQLASPDYVQVNKARYGVDLSMGVAQKPIYLGSADFPMFTSGVEQTAGSSQETQNPFSGVAARFGRGHAEGSDFVCEGHVNEPGYLMVMVSLVPEANYANGFAHDMRIFIEEGSLVDLPVASLERIGSEPVYSEEIADLDSINHRSVFGYQPQRYMWHKAGQLNEVHGLFRKGLSLGSFIPQREASGGGLFGSIDTDFLKVQPTDLDNVMAVSGSLSQYGVMIDSKIDLFVSEPLGESVLPSLVDPAQEHGKDVYLVRGGSNSI